MANEQKITIKDLKQLHGKFKKEVERAMNKDQEITIQGNGCNAHEVSNAIDQYDDGIAA